jgi:NADH dehydrogenase
MVARGLLSQGHAVRVLVRPGPEYGELVKLGAQPMMGDLKDPESLARVCAGVTTVVTTANSSARSEPDTVDAVDRQGNRALIDAARAAGCEHFIFVSALGASAENPVDFFRAKADTERHLAESGMDYTIVKPNIFMEVWIGMIVGMPLQQGMPVTLIGRGDHRHAMISTRDVAAFTVAAVSNPAARNATLVVGGPDALTWTQVVERAESVLGHSLGVQYVAPGEPLPGLPPVAGQFGALFETYESVIDMSEATATYGVRLTTIDDFLRELLRPPIDA